jgi:hypothetical protein
MKILIATLLCLTLGRIAFAQPAAATTVPSTFPSTSPSTQPARHEVVVPPGFVKVTAAERTALCLPADQAWVVKNLTELQPTTRPTTMPSDLLDTFTAKKADLLKQMAGDLGLADSNAIAAVFTDNLLPEMSKLADFRPPIFYLVCTKSQLLAAVHTGWSDPRFYYNRITDDVSVQSAVDLSADHPIDDLLIPIVYKDTDNPAEKAQDLQKQVDRNEASVAASMSIQGQVMLQKGFVSAIDAAAIQPIALKPGQEWFGIGLEGLLATKYMTEINGMQYDDLVKMVTEDDPRNPIRSATVDLLHPVPPNELNPNYAPAYIDALRRKSVAAINALITQGGPDVLPKIFAAIKQNQPKDGEALVAMIKQTVNVDLHDRVIAK